MYVLAVIDPHTLDTSLADNRASILLQKLKAVHKVLHPGEGAFHFHPEGSLPLLVNRTYIFLN